MLSIADKISYKKLAVLGIGTIFVFFVIFKTTVDLKAFITTAKNAKNIYLLYALLAILPTFILSPLRWFYVLKAYGYRLEFKKIFYAVTAANAFILIPGRIGDFVQGYFIKNTVPTAEAIGSVVVEKIIDVIVLLLLAGIGFLLLSFYIYALLAFVAAGGVLGSIWIIKKIGNHIGLTKMGIVKKVAEAIRIPNQPNYIIASGVASGLNWLNSIVSTYFLFFAFQAILPFSAVLAYLPITLFIGLIPITIAGIGIRDGAIIRLFSAYANASQALTVGICYSFLGYFLFMLAGIPLTIRYLLKDNGTS